MSTQAPSPHPPAVTSSAFAASYLGGYFWGSEPRWRDQAAGWIWWRTRRPRDLGTPREGRCSPAAAQRPTRRCGPNPRTRPTTPYSPHAPPRPGHCPKRWRHWCPRNSPSWRRSRRPQGATRRGQGAVGRSPRQSQRRGRGPEGRGRASAKRGGSTGPRCSSPGRPSLATTEGGEQPALSGGRGLKVRGGALESWSPASLGASGGVGALCSLEDGGDPKV